VEAVDAFFTRHPVASEDLHETPALGGYEECG
jgi:hypothetical protein